MTGDFMLDTILQPFKWLLGVYVGYCIALVYIGALLTIVAPFLVVWDFNKACKRFNNQ